MKKNVTKQHIPQNTPIDIELRCKAAETGRVFNQGAASESGYYLIAKRDLSDIAGTLSEEEANSLEQEIKRQHQIEC